MKKLALALVCLVSVAFFASCDPTIQNPEPNIAILNEEGCLLGGEVLDMNEVYTYGFIATSNSQTLKELTNFVIVCGETTLCDTAISGTEFKYKGEIYFTNKGSKDVTPLQIVATVTDAAGNTATATIKVDINEVEEVELVPTEFTWNRHGGADATGLEEFGLQWTSNTKEEVFANIRPLDGAALYEFDPSVWDATTTDLEKAALFSELTFGISVFRGVSCNASADYDYVIGTTYNGENHLIHITRAEVHKFKGTDITITGEAK